MLALKPEDPVIDTNGLSKKYILCSHASYVSSKDQFSNLDELLLEEVVELDYLHLKKTWNSLCLVTSVLPKILWQTGSFFEQNIYLICGDRSMLWRKYIPRWAMTSIKEKLAKFLYLVLVQTVRSSMMTAFG